MTRFKKFGAIFFISTYLFIGGALIVPRASFAATTVKFTPQIGIPGSNFQQGVSTTIGATADVVNPNTGKSEQVMRSDLLARYIAAFYNWGLYIVGALAVLMLMAAGIVWITSMGDSGKIGQAKKMIGGSIMGTALLVGAWFFLNTINPDLTKLPSIDSVIIGSVATGCCKTPGVAWDSMALEKDCQGTFDPTQTLDVVSHRCAIQVCCVGQSNTDSITDVTYCIDGVQGKCKAGKQDSRLCSNIPECDNNIVGCETPSKIGGSSQCDMPNGPISDGCYCYNGNPYIGLGALNEYCGNNDSWDGVCIKSADACVNTDSGGRSCGSGLKCCGEKVYFGNQCKDQNDGTSCKLTSDAVNGTGFCLNEVCTRCTDPFAIMSTGFPGRCKYNYQCKNTSGFCGNSFPGGSCSDHAFCISTVDKTADTKTYEDGNKCDTNTIADNCLYNHCCAGLCCAYTSAGTNDICLPGPQNGASGAGKTHENGPNACSAGLYTEY